MKIEFPDGAIIHIQNKRIIQQIANSIEQSIRKSITQEEIETGEFPKFHNPPLDPHLTKD